MSFFGEYIAKMKSKSQIIGFSPDSVLKFSADINNFIEFPKIAFAFFDRLFSSILLWESNYDAKLLFTVFNGNIF